jgi:hypothetical protein
MNMGSRNMIGEGVECPGSGSNQMLTINSLPMPHQDNPLPIVLMSGDTSGTAGQGCQDGP